MERIADPNRDAAVGQSNAALQRSASTNRRAYTPPRLIVYGRVRDLTRTVGRRGRKDSKRGRRRTGF